MLSTEVEIRVTILRHAWNSLTAEPDVTAIVVLVLLLGIGHLRLAPEPIRGTAPRPAVIEESLPADLELDLAPGTGIGPIRFEIRRR